MYMYLHRNATCTCTSILTHTCIHVQAHMYMYAHTARYSCMRSTWKSPLPNMIRVHFRSGLLWGKLRCRHFSGDRRASCLLASSWRSSRLRLQQKHCGAWEPGGAAHYLQGHKTTPKSGEERSASCCDPARLHSASRPGPEPQKQNQIAGTPTIWLFPPP